MQIRLLFVLFVLVWHLPGAAGDAADPGSCFPLQQPVEQVECFRRAFDAPIGDDQLARLEAYLPERGDELLQLLDFLSTEHQAQIDATPSLAATLFDLRGQALVATEQVAAAVSAYESALAHDDGTAQLVLFDLPTGKARVVRLDVGDGRIGRAARANLLAQQVSEARELLRDALSLGDLGGWAEETSSGLDAGIVYPWLSTSPWHERPDDLEFPLIDGNSYRLSDARGKVLLLDFWASWCEPCMQELPVLQALYQAEHENGLEMVAVNHWEQVQQARSFVESLKLTMPIGFMTREIENALPIPSLPTVILLDRSGAIRHGWSGGEVEVLKELGQEVHALLADEQEEPVEVARVVKGAGVLELLWVRPAARSIEAIGVVPLEEGGAHIVSVMRDLLVLFDAKGSIKQELRARTNMSLMRPHQLADGRTGLVGFRPGSRDITILDPPSETVSAWQAPSPVFDVLVLDAGTAEAVASSLLLATLEGLWQSDPAGGQVEQQGDVREITSLGAIGRDGTSAVVVLDAGSGVSELDDNHDLVTRHEPPIPEDSWHLFTDPRLEGSVGVASAAVLSWVIGDFLDGDTLQLALATRSEQLILVDLPGGEVRFRAHWPGIAAVAAGDLDGEGRPELVVRSDRQLAVLQGRMPSSQ